MKIHLLKACQDLNTLISHGSHARANKDAQGRPVVGGSKTQRYYWDTGGVGLGEWECWRWLHGAAGREAV